MQTQFWKDKYLKEVARSAELELGAILGKDAVEKVEALEKENKALTSKVTTLENKITKLTANGSAVGGSDKPSKPTRAVNRQAQLNIVEPVVEDSKGDEGDALEALTKVELKAMCKELGISGISDFGKAELIEAIRTESTDVEIDDVVIVKEEVVEDVVEEVAPAVEVPVRPTRPARGVAKPEAVVAPSVRPPRRSSVK